MPEIRASTPGSGFDREKQPSSATGVTEDDRRAQQDETPPSMLSQLYHRYTYTPERVRYYPDRPVKFTTFLNVLFAFAGTFTVANLYYAQPILNRLAHDFNVSYEQSARIPTLGQAGYACGMAFICPLGDVLRRRPFTLYLVWITATLWLGLCVTKSFTVFCALSFLTGLTTVTPQIMLPLIGDLAPMHRRAQALSLVVSGLILGMLIARLLSGIVAQYIGWRYIYWISFGLQYLILIGLYLFMPDYPATNTPKSVIRYYPRLLFDIVRLFVTEPLIVQICLIGFCTSVIFMSFWTTLTFLLADDPYNYSSLVIGLFALIGIGSMAWGPIFARTVMDKFIPMFSTVFGELIVLTAVIIGTYTGLHTVAGPIIEALFLDIGIQTAQIANRSALYSVAPLARNRVNTCYMVVTFAGQLTGTAAGNHLYAQGGWIRSGSANVGFVGLALFICLVRGPHEKHWLGWRGGWNLRKGVPTKDQAERAEVEAAGVTETTQSEGIDADRNVARILDSEKHSLDLDSGETLGTPASAARDSSRRSSIEKDIG